MNGMPHVRHAEQAAVVIALGHEVEASAGEGDYSRAEDPDVHDPGAGDGSRTVPLAAGPRGQGPSGTDATRLVGGAAPAGARDYSANIGWSIPREDLLVFFASQAQIK